MRIPAYLTEDRDLRRVFSWLTRTGIGPRFGSRPIGWYQMHLMCAVDELKHAAGVHKNSQIEVRAVGDTIQARKPGSKRWQRIGTARDLYHAADSCARK